jgi:hypothetical protein
MYGIVNKAIQELVIENFGKEKWEIIKEKCNINVDIGLGKMYNTPANVVLIQEKNEVNDHEVFKVSW